MQRSRAQRARAPQCTSTILAALFALGCQSRATVVGVQFDTDAPANRLIRVQVTVHRANGSTAPTRSFERGPGARESFSTPASLTIIRAPEAPIEESARLVVEARVEPTATAPAVVFRRTMRFQFTANTTTWLRLFLPTSCGAPSTGCRTASGAACTVSVRCEEQGLTCGDEGRCVAIDVTPSPNAPDGAVDMDASAQGNDGGADSAMDTVSRPDGTAMDAATDAPTDASVDSGCPGSCPARANTTVSCAGSTCTYACNAAFGDCDNEPANGCEASLDTAAHCGLCTTSCSGATPLCQSMSCVSGCGAQTLCGSSCVDLQTSNLHCGMCSRACTGGQTCAAGACRCSGSQTLCSGTCVDLSTNPIHCGACGRACLARQSCVAGACACGTGEALCSGTCVNLQTDNNHCGMCARVCGSGQTCVAGSCACPAGQTLCSGTCVNLQTDNSNCGTCGRACSGGQTCAAGSCACPAGQTFCSGTCVNLQSNPSHCGMCGRACPGGCNSGQCAPSNDTCATATPVNVVNTDIMGTTCGAASHVGNCAPGQPDVFYAVQLPIFASLVRVTAITGGPYSLALMGSLCGSAAVSCAGSTYSGAFVPGLTLWVGVLSPPGSCGTFALRFET